MDVKKKRVIWEKNNLVNICLSDSLYTVAQMLDSPVMCFYDIKNKDGIWDSIDLANINILFMVLVNNSINKDFIIEKINRTTYIDKTLDQYFIKPYTIMDGIHYKGGKNSFPFLGGKLIKYDSTIGSVRSPIIKEDLTFPQDREIMEKYELTNMWGKEELRERLVRYFSKGINRDDLKYEVFPDLWKDKEKHKPLSNRLPEPLR
jgi:hypothetical protein